MSQLSNQETAFKQVRIRNLPTGWDLGSVGEDCNIRNELRLPISESEREKMKGDFPYYGPTGILDYINEYRLDGTFATIGEDGDHFLKFADRPMTQLIRGKFNVNNHAHIIEGTARCLTEWFYYFFQHKDITHILSRQGAGRYKLNKATLEKLPILLPPLAEQRKIAAILSTWDAAIAAAERLVAALRARKRALMQRLLTGEVRFPGFEGEWERIELRECLTPISRTEIVQRGRQYNLIGVRWYLEGAHIHDSVSGDNILTHQLSQIHEGDVLYNKMWVTKAAFAVAKKEHHGSYGTNEYPQFRAQSNLDIRFIEYAFHNPRFLHDAQSLCRGTTGRARLNPDDFLTLQIFLPSKAEQGKIAAALSSCDEEISRQEQQLALLRQQKRGLMQRLLTGELRVAGDEVR